MNPNMHVNNKIIYASLVLLLLVGLAGYYFITKPSDNSEENLRIQEPESARIETITIGTISEDAAGTIKVFQPAADYVAAKLSNNRTEYKGKVVVAISVENESDLLKEQKLDLLLESPLTAAIISKKSGSIPFLRRWKDRVPQYHSLFIVRKDSPVETLDDINGKTIAFEDPGSTSGYLLPKIYLIQKGFNVSQFPGKNNIAFVFSGNGKNTPLWVVERKADAGALSNLDLENTPVSIREELKVIDRTIDVPRHVVSYRSGLDPVLAGKIRQIFLNMDKDPQGIEIMNITEKTKKFDEYSEEEILNISRMVDVLK